VAGHVFHPGHQELHGITVVLETTGPGRTWGGSAAGTSAGACDVGVHDDVGGRVEGGIPASLRHVRDRPEHRDLLVPAGEVASIHRLVDVLR
jgi:hypothetical protein